MTNLSAKEYKESREQDYIFNEYYKDENAPKRANTKSKRIVKKSKKRKVKKRPKKRLKKRRAKKRRIVKSNPKPKAQVRAVNKPIISTNKQLKKKKIRVPKGYRVVLDKYVGKYAVGGALGYTNLLRDVTLKSNLTGQVLTRNDTGDSIGTADGSTYKFKQRLTYNRYSFVFGFKEYKTEDFIFASFYGNDLIQDILITYGYSLPSFKTPYLLNATPYMSISGGFGHTDSENGVPTNWNLGVGIGIKKEFMKNFDLDFGLMYQKRAWVEIDRALGSEKWSDSENTIYLGVHYLF